MREVKVVPKREVGREFDPWLSKILDGKQRCLSPKDWDIEEGGRYKNRKSAVAAIRQAAAQRGIPVAIAARREKIYVKADKLNGS